MVSPTIERARFLQMGKQSALGTAVDATFRYPTDLTFQEDTQRYEPGYPQGVRTDIAGQLVDMVNKTTLQVQGDLTFEEIISYLAMCVHGGVTPTTVDTDGKQWVFAPPVSGDPSPNPFTFEFAPSNFSSSYGRQVPDCLCDKITLKGSFNKTCTFTASLFGRKSVPSFTPTDALTNVTGREIAAAPLSKIYIDDDAADLGTTQLLGTILDWEATIQGGLMADYTLDGRASLDYTQYLVGDVNCELKLTCEYTSAIDTEIGNWRSKTPRFARVAVPGSLITAAPKLVQFDMCGEYVAAPTISTSNGIDTASLTLKGKYDPTWANIFQATVVNKLGSLT